MLTSKQRAHLRSIAQGYNAIFFVGKNGIGEELVKQLDDVLESRELIKVGVQENCEYTAREAADEIAQQLNADVVQVIGRKFVLWRRSKDPKKRVIELD
ncbi:MAG: ribosome assembly RNA-binding protein YhbY [Oscillospiraceae bacterium]|nr:ribosome assembly RNA-binding protein YhbY [Oscillospiraceae bacterium]